MMLRWEDFQPVNAIHVIELAGRHDATRTRELARQVSRSLGVRPISFDPRRHSLCLHEDEASAGEPEFRLLTLSSPRLGLEAAIQEELSRPFGPGPLWPLRFLLIEEPPTGRQSLAVVYPHAISDSRGISLIVREILRAMGGLPPLVERLDFHPPELKQLFPAELSWRGAPRRALTSVRELIEFTSCFAPPKRPGTFAIEPGIPDVSLSVQTLKESAKRLGGTVQTLIGAAFTEALALNFADEIASSRRKSISIYTPVDLRRESPVPVDSAVGQILGSMTTRVPFVEGMPLSQVAHEIARQSGAQRASRQYREHSAHMNVLSWWWDRVPRSVNRVASPFLMPLTGFISNVNLADFLAEEVAAGLVRDYRRFTGTSIQAPMMLALTTVGSRANLTTTHPSNVFTREEMDRIVAHVAWRLSGAIETLATRSDFLARPLQTTPMAPRRAA